MAMSVAEVSRWLATLEPGSSVAVSEDGNTLVELDADGDETAAYLEIGGIPDDDDDDPTADRGDWEAHQMRDE